MSSERNFRISLDLSRFFNDHRRSARVFVKKDLKTVEDLKDHIAHIFEIDNFYLTSVVSDQYLPEVEDVRILQNDETVRVLPSITAEAKSSEDNGSSQSISKKSRKRLLYAITEEPFSSPKPKKQKSNKHLHNQPATDEDGTSTRSNKSVEDRLSLENPKRLKKKLKKINVQSDPGPDSSVNANFTDGNDEVTPQEERTSKSGSLKLFSNKSSLESCDTSVRLSRHEDTPFRHKKYTAPQRTTEEYLSRNAINIVKVEIVPKPEKRSVTADTCPIKASLEASPPENYVKTVVERFEKIITPPEGDEKSASTKRSDANQNHPSNYTKIYLDQKVANASFTNNEQGTNLENQLVTSQMYKNPLYLSATDLSHRSEIEEIVPEPDGKKLPEKSVNAISCIGQSTPKYHTKQNSSLNGKIIDLVSPQPSVVSLNTSHSVNNTTTLSEPEANNLDLSSSVSPRTGSVAGTLMETESVGSENSHVSLRLQNRKRIRKRVKKSKKLNNNVDCTSTCNHQVLKPLNVVSDSNTHIRFDAINGENDNKQVEGEYAKKFKTDNETVVLASNSQANVALPQVEEMPIDQEKEVIFMEDKPIFSQENIENSPSMKGKLDPKVGDIIAFKILKISANYTPELSNYICGKVVNYSAESKVVYFRILGGAQEFARPYGKFSLEEEEEVNNVQECVFQWLPWAEIVDPRLLWP